MRIFTEIDGLSVVNVPLKNISLFGVVTITGDQLDNFIAIWCFRPLSREGSSCDIGLGFGFCGLICPI